MKTTNNKKAVLVGAFILGGLAIFIAGILTLGGQKKTFEKKVAVKAVFSNVGGLHTGNNVWFLGVKVGTIKKMSFIGHSQVEIVMNIESDARSYIMKDAKAKVSSDGFIGNKIVVIYGGTENSSPIGEGDVLAVENGLNTEEILATFQENNKNLLDITANIKLLSKQMVDGKGAVGKLLSDPVLANNLEVAVAGFRQASANAQRLTADISAYTGRLQSEGSLTNDLVTDTVVFAGLKSAVAQFQQMTKTGNEVTENLKLASNNIRDVSSNLSNSKSPVGVLLNDQEAGDHLKLLLANLQTGSQKLDENMEALQHNFLLRGFFKKKAKEAKKNSKDTASSLNSYKQ
jgi:phospholipid/cholesterol/gamma-HCH transport system substrate-binding protein